MIKYILLNGPKHCGKSTIARELCRDLNMLHEVKDGAAIVDSFGAPFKHFVATALGEGYNNLNKERPMPEFNGECVREFVVSLAETYIKERYGKDIFGKWLHYRNLRNPMKLPLYVIVDDSRYPEDAGALPERLFIHIRRPNCAFRDEPNGEYLFNEKGMHQQFDNDGSIMQLFMRVRGLARMIYDKELEPHA